jgi:hypothetical protein
MTKAINLFFNFGRCLAPPLAIRRDGETLKGQTPAMASGLTDHAWTIKELIERAAAC